LASVRRRQRADDASRAVCWSKAASTTAGSHQRVQSPLAQKQPQPPEHEILSPLHEQSAMCDSFAWSPWQAAPDAGLTGRADERIVAVVDDRHDPEESFNTDSAVQNAPSTQA
jgi:hypothetical protein